jgi:fatty acid amide hydrolase 2
MIKARSLSGVQLSAMIKRKEISSAYLTELYIQQILSVNPSLNAMCYDCFEDARKRALEYDNIVANPETKIEELSPVFGVPFISKECYQIPNKPYTCGIPGRRGVLGTEYSEVLQMLIDADAIILCSGNLSEAAMWIESDNAIYGRTNNAYCAERTCGGSSGGTAALVASSCGGFGLTSDVGGSTRIPAFYNGIFGLKPTGGLVSNKNNYPPPTGDIDRYCQLGPSSRHCEDIWPILKLISKPGKLQGNPKDVDVTKLRFVYLGDSFNSFLISKRDPELVRAELRVVEHLKNKGLQVETRTYDKLSKSFFMWSAKMDQHTETPYCNIVNMNPFVEIVKWVFGYSVHQLPSILLALFEYFTNLLPFLNNQYFRMFEQLKAELNEVLDDRTVLISPSLPNVAPKHGELMYKLKCFDSGFTSIYNVLEFPAIQVPLGLDSDGLPLGVQIVSNCHKDHLCVAVAQYLENEGVARFTPPDAY